MTDLSESRVALLAGATGLVGRALLGLLQDDPHYRGLHVLLRRAVNNMPSSGKLQVHRVDFAHLPAAFPAVDDVYIALGTTIAVAGSEAVFRQVDFDFVVATARAARATGARRLAVVSALGADTGSRVFYNRVKGEMQEAVAKLGYPSLVIAQPSLLLGDRAALGQPMRAGERWAARLVGPIRRIVPAALRPIEASAVAAAMIAAMRDSAPGLRILKSADMQPRAASTAARA